MTDNRVSPADFAELDRRYAHGDELVVAFSPSGIIGRHVLAVHAEVGRGPDGAVFIKETALRCLSNISWSPRRRLGPRPARAQGLRVLSWKSEVPPGFNVSVPVYDTAVPSEAFGVVKVTTMLFVPLGGLTRYQTLLIPVDVACVIAISAYVELTTSYPF